MQEKFENALFGSKKPEVLYFQIYFSSASLFWLRTVWTVNDIPGKNHVEGQVPGYMRFEIYESYFVESSAPLKVLLIWLLSI